jgi:CHAT domain-containing protein
LPPPRRAVQTLAECMFAALKALSVLGCLHSDLLVASQSQRRLSTVEPIDAAIAAGKAQRDAGHYEAAIREFDHGLRLAQTSQRSEESARCLILIGASRTRLFQYREALAAGQEALQIARQLNNYTLAGAASSNIAAIYRQVGDFAAAEQAAARAVELMQRAPVGDAQAQDFLVRAMMIRASLCFLQGKLDEGEKWSGKAIELARQIHNPLLEALAWDDSGAALLADRRLAQANRALQSAYQYWQKSHNLDELAVTKAHLAELELNKPNPDYTAALQLIDEAFTASGKSFKSISQYYPIHIRGRILLQLGRKNAALEEFRKAVRAAGEWRRGALPGDATNSQTAAALNEVYADFAQLAAEISQQTHSLELRTEALEVLAENRAASLREQLALALGLHFRLPGDYFRKLSELQTAQARVTLGSNSAADNVQLTTIRLELGALENQLGIEAGKTESLKEKKSRRNSLRDIQRRLSDAQLLLSFCLGKKKSFLWATSVDQVTLYELAGEHAISTKIASFSNAIKNGGDSAAPGQDLKDALFGQLPKTLHEKPEWLIVGEGALLSGVPFAALPDAKRHSLRLLPSELLLLGPVDRRPVARFVGVGDPIYNPADSRLRSQSNQPTGRTESDASEISLARLAGSALEIRASARLSGLTDTQLLTGPLASSAELQRSLGGSPEIVHFAVHVVSPPARPGEAALALSLKQGLPELLTSEEIATYRLPESLVVLSGCASDRGKTLPGAGLMGLSRAWLLAGAAAVIVSAWPTPDDSGRFFSAFYSRFQAQAQGTVKAGQMARLAALALQGAQVDMQSSSGYSKAPSFWAAYSIISKE